MVDEHLRQHVRRQMHGRPTNFNVESANPTPTPTETSSSTTMGPGPTDVSEASFLYPVEQVTVNNIDVVQVQYQSNWDNVNLTVFCEMSPGSDQFALAKINQSMDDLDIANETRQLILHDKSSPQEPTQSHRSRPECRYQNSQPIAIS
jgi:hypothetical protein